jgi:hypothetical protein
MRHHKGEIGESNGLKKRRRNKSPISMSMFKQKDGGGNGRDSNMKQTKMKR